VHWEEIFTSSDGPKVDSWVGAPKSNPVGGVEELYLDSNRG